MVTLSGYLNWIGMKSGRFKIPLVYVAAGILWIILSDSAMVSFSPHEYHWSFRVLSLTKGMLFVIGTGVILFLLLNKEKIKARKNENQYRNMYEGNPNPIWFYDPLTFRFVSVNDAAVARYGYSREEFLEMTIFDIRPDEDAEKVRQSYLRMTDQLNDSGAWRHTKKDGGVIYVTVSSHKTILDNKEVVMVMPHDTTEKYLYEQQLKRTGEMLSKINNPVIIANADGEIIWVNPSFTTITGHKAEDVIGLNHLSMLYSDNTNLDVIEQMLIAVSKKEVFSADMVNYDKSGREHWVSLNLSPIFDANGKLEYYISVQNDITEYKEKETVIGIQHEKLQAVSWLNSHQIRKPVASILALCQLMKSADSETEKDELLGLLYQCAQELDEIIIEINAEASGRSYK